MIDFALHTVFRSTSGESSARWFLKSFITLVIACIALTPLSAQVTAVGSETIANTTTANSQQNATVAMDDNGNYLVVWESYGNDGSGYGIFGQWHNANGTLNGSEFQVNTVAEKDARFPKVAVTADGRSSIVWMEDEEDGSGWTLKARIYNSSHAAVTSAFSIRTSSNGQQRWPDVDMDNSGNSYITWTQVATDLSSYIVYAQVRNAAGTATVSQFQVNDATTSFSGYSRIAAEENGDFVVVWQSLGIDTATSHGILAERFNSAGTSQGSEFLVNTEVTGNQTYPDVAMDSVGNFTVVWTSEAQDGDADGVFGQRYLSAGTASGSEFQVATTTAGFQNVPEIDMSKEGTAVVAWNSYGTDGSFDGVYLQAYNADGTASGTQTIVNTTTTNFQQNPAVALYPISNDVVLAWQDGLRNSSSTNDGSEYGIYSQRFSITPPLSVSLSVTDVVCSGSSTGAIAATASDGSSPYTYAWSTGATTATISTLAAGTYTITVTDNNGSTVVETETVSAPGSALTASATVNTNVSCNGASDGSATASASGGTAAFTYSWSNGATTAAISSLAAGTYSVTITDANGCTDSASVSLTQPSGMTASAAVNSSVSCNGVSDGQATASQTGGTSAYTYSWNDGQTTAIASSLAAGTYSVTITDANGCTDSASVTITQPTVLSATATVNNTVSCNGASDGSATASASGGTTAYTYAWSNGATSAAISSLAAGTYTVTITDANGCTGSASVSITQPTLLSATATVNNHVSCGGDTDGSATASASGGTTAYTYTWSNGATTAAISSLAAGTYSVTITDANGCTGSASVSITQPTALSASAAVNNNVTCGGNTDGSATASASGGTAAYTYAWSNGATTAAISSLAAGTYSVTITDANGCTDSASVSLTQPSGMTASAAVNNSVSCNGVSDGQATASQTGGTSAYTYSWNDGQTTATASSLAAGTYSVTITDANGCTDSASVTITQPTALSATATVNNTVSCNGASDGSATASASGGTTAYTYAWSNGATSAAISSLAAGTYTVTITDANGCTGSASVSITQPTLLSATATVNNHVSCGGDTDGSATASASGGTTAYTYAWSNGATTAAISSLAAGTYSVTITDANGCTGSASVSITQPTALSASAVVNNNVTCGGNTDGSATASASGGTTAYTYSWSNGATTAAISSLAAGTYSVTITDANGCTDSASVILTQPSGMTASALVFNGVSCNGGSDGGVSSFASGGTSPYTYSWNNGATTDVVLSLSAGTYTVTLTDANGCTATASVGLPEPTALSSSAVVNGNVSCNGDADGNATASASGGTAPYTYAWSNGDITAAISNLLAGTYSVTLTDDNGCTDSSSVTITEPNQLEALASAADVTCNGGNDGDLFAGESGGTTPYTFLWSNGSTNSSVISVTAGTYTVTLTDANGCSAVQSTTVNQPSAISLSASATANATCAGATGAANSNVSGGTASYTYLWSNGASTASITGLSAGVYTLTVTDGNGCTATDTTAVSTLSSSVTTSISVDNNVSCNGFADGALTASATSGTTPYTYLWSNAASTATISGLAAGTYTVTVTDNNGCSDNASATITEPTGLSLTTSSTSNVSCNGSSDGSIAILASGGTPNYTYVWSNGGSFAAANNNITAGTYTLTVTDANGCTATISETISEPTILVATASSLSSVSCNGGSDGQANASGSGGTTPYTYSWSNGSTAASPSGLSAGQYIVTITDANGCTDSNNILITEPSALVITATTTANVTCGGTNGTASSSVSGGSSPYTYSWSNGATTSSNSNLSAGTYTLTVTDANGCTGSDTNLVSAGASTVVASVTVDDNVSCFGFTNGGLTASATNGTSPYTYSWSNGAISASISGLAAGSYTVTVTDAVGCSDNASATITEPTALGITTTVANITCNGAADGSISSTPSGGTPTYTYLWSNGSTAGSISGLSVGTYTVTMTDANGCSVVQSETIAEPAALVVSASTTSNVTCNTSGTALAGATGGTPPYTYLWSNGSSNATANNLSAGTYTVTVTDANSCTGTASTTITSVVSLSLAVSATDANCNGLSDGTATGTATNGTTPYTYLWSNSSTTANLSAISAGTYTLTVTDGAGCTATDFVVVGEPLALSANFAISPESGAGNDGSVTASPTGGTSPYTYAWSTGATTATISGLTAATYALTLTDVNGCSIASPAEVLQDSASIYANIASSFCGTTVASLNTYITYSGVSGATNYRYLVTASGFSTVHTRGYAASNFQLAIISGVTYNTTYSISIAALVGGVWQPYGPACQISTPAVIPTTTLNSNSCGIALTDLSTWLYIDAVPGASNYRYRVTATGFSYVYTRGYNATNFRLDFVPGVSYNVIYNVEVAAFVNGVWQPYGAICTVAAPNNIPLTQLVTSQCNITLSSWNQYLFYNSVPGADNYRLEVTNAGLGFSSVLVRGYQWTTWRFDWVANNLQSSTTYDVRVAASVNGNWANYGPVCTITTPASAQPRLAEEIVEAPTSASVEDLVVYPNPTRGAFYLQGLWETGEKLDLELYDLTGRLVYRNNYQIASDNASVEISAGILPQGVYVIRVRDAQSTYTRNLVVH